MLSFGIEWPQSFCHSFIAMSMICCSKSAQKFAVQVSQIATVVIETTQLVLSQLKNSLSSRWRIEYGLSVSKIISKCCELVKLCHTNCCGPFFLRHTVVSLSTVSDSQLWGRNQTRQNTRQVSWYAKAVHIWQLCLSVLPDSRSVWCIWQHLGRQRCSLCVRLAAERWEFLWWQMGRSWYSLFVLCRCLSGTSGETYLRTYKHNHSCFNGQFPGLFGLASGSQRSLKKTVWVVFQMLSLSLNWLYSRHHEHANVHLCVCYIL